MFCCKIAEVDFWCIHAWDKQTCKMDTTLIKLHQSQMHYWYFVDFQHSISVSANFSDSIGYPPKSTSVFKIVIFLSRSLECHRGEPLPGSWACSPRKFWNLDGQEVKFCLKCLLNWPSCLCLYLFVWLRVQVLNFIWSTSLCWHVHGYPGLLSLVTLVCLCLMPDKCG